jgi:hypothetical protein
MTLLHKDLSRDIYFDASIVSKINLVLTHSQNLHLSNTVIQKAININRSKKFISSLKVDWSSLDLFLCSHAQSLSRIKLVNIIFHCPFTDDTLPGTFYMPPLRQVLVDRAYLITKIAQLHHSLNHQLNPVTLLITTKQWYIQHKTQFDKAHNICPVFLRVEMKHPMYMRQSAYTACLAYLQTRSHFLSDKCCIAFHDSDLLPVASWDSIVRMLNNTSINMLFTHRHSPNILPVNGGLFFSTVSEKSLLLMHYLHGLYDQLAEDSCINDIYPSNIKVWDGDQIALNAICSWNMSSPFYHKLPDQLGSIAIYPAQRYNYSVKEISKEVKDNIQANNVCAIHLKGAIKENLDRAQINEFLKDLTDL